MNMSMNVKLDQLFQLKNNLNELLISRTAYMISEIEIGASVKDIDLIDDCIIGLAEENGLELKEVRASFSELVLSKKMRLEFVQLNKGFESSTYRRI